MGGVNMLRALGHHGLRRFHMNEGHASLLPLALLDEQAKRAGHARFTLSRSTVRFLILSAWCCNTSRRHVFADWAWNPCKLHSRRIKRSALCMSGTSRAGLKKPCVKGVWSSSGFIRMPRSRCWQSTCGFSMTCIGRRFLGARQVAALVARPTLKRRDGEQITINK
jgi:hypothetical protein